MKKIIAISLVLIVTFATLAACTPNQQDTATTTTTTTATGTTPAAQTTTGETGESDRLIVGMTGDVGTFNPHITTLMLEFRMLQNVFDALVRTNPLTGETEPQLAESWTISDDGLVYTFNLRQDVTFHNGDPFNAYNILGNFEIWQTSVNAVRLRNALSDVRVIDEFTVEMTLVEPSALFLIFLGDQAIVHDQVLLANPELFSEQPVGTGAYKLTGRHIGSSIEFTRFEEHFRGPADIEVIEIRILPDANTLAIAMEMGEIDYSEAIPPASVPLLEAIDHLDVNVIEGVMVTFLSLNVERAPFNDIRVRQAIAHAIDRQMVIDMAVEGFGTPTHITHITPMPFRPTGYPVFEFNPDRSRELLAEAGFPNGLVLDDAILTAPWSVAPSQVVQNMLAAVGITVDVAPMEHAAMSPLTQDGDYLLAFSGWNSTSLHPEFFVQLYRSDAIGSINFPRHSNPRVDELADLAIVTMDPSAVQEIYNELFYIITYEAPRVPIYINASIIVHDSNLVVNQMNSISNTYFNMSWR